MCLVNKLHGTANFKVLGYPRVANTVQFLFKQFDVTDFISLKSQAYGLMTITLNMVWFIVSQVSIKAIITGKQHRASELFCLIFYIQFKKKKHCLAQCLCTNILFFNLTYSKN